MTTETKTKTLVVFVQDETGSMHPIADQTISAFNEYFDALKRDTDDPDAVTVQVWQFSLLFSRAAGEADERVRQFHDGPLSKVPRLTTTNYRPRGNTPLLDAVGTAIKQAEVADVDRFVFIVQTDGEENSSTDFTRSSIEEMVAEKEKDDRWSMVFMGADVPGWHDRARAMGASPGSTAAYASSQTGRTYSSVAGQTVSVLNDPAMASNKNMGTQVEVDNKEEEEQS